MNGDERRSTGIHRSPQRYMGVPGYPMDPPCTPLWSLIEVSAEAHVRPSTFMEINDDRGRSMKVIRDA